MKIIIVDDHPLVRKGIKSLLLDEDNIDSIIEASNVKEGIDAIKIQKPDIAIIDLRLGKESGLSLIESIRINDEKMKFIILSSYISQEDFKKAEDLEVNGFILKDAFSEDILYAINVVSRGKKYYDSEILRDKGNNKNSDLLDKLTDREKDVLQEISKGLSNTEIAKQLYISEHTVKKHVSSILSKFNVDHRSQIVYMVNNTKLVL